MILPNARLGRFISSLLLTALPLTLGGCGRSPAGTAGLSASSDAPSTSTGNTRNTDPRPTHEEVTAFFSDIFPPAVVRADVQMDDPVRPNGSNVWLIPVKLTFAPVVDLFDKPEVEEMAGINHLIEEQNALIAWRDSFVQSDFGKMHSANLKFGSPAVPPSSR